MYGHNNLHRRSSRRLPNGLSSPRCLECAQKNIPGVLQISRSCFSYGSSRCGSVSQLHLQPPQRSTLGSTSKDNDPRRYTHNPMSTTDLSSFSPIALLIKIQNSATTPLFSTTSIKLINSGINHPLCAGRGRCTLTWYSSFIEIRKNSATYVELYDRARTGYRNWQS